MIGTPGMNHYVFVYCHSLDPGPSKVGPVIPEYLRFPANCLVTRSSPTRLRQLSMLLSNFIFLLVSRSRFDKLLMIRQTPDRNTSPLTPRRPTVFEPTNRSSFWLKHAIWLSLDNRVFRTGIWISKGVFRQNSLASSIWGSIRICRDSVENQICWPLTSGFHSVVCDWRTGTD